MTAGQNKKKPLPIGVSDFKELRENGWHYVDKSLFIREFLDTWSKVFLFPRPRRFGKTLNLSMLRYFFEKSEEDRRSLFDGLAIRSDPVFETHQGKYPVIWMTFKDLKAPDWKEMYEGICRIISRETERHSEVLERKEIPPTARKHLKSLTDGIASKRAYEESLAVLSEQLKVCYGEQVIILIDEYDTPLHAGYSKGYYDKIIGFMRNFLSGGLKDNKHLFRGVLTGILRVAKESVFSGLNNPGVYTVLDRGFSDAFGFRENEVKSLLADYGNPEQYEEMSYWYNGYLFGETVIYNPWSVLNYLSRKGEKARPWWVNTADTELIDTLATRGGKELREEIGLLLEGGTVTKPVYDSIVMKDLDQRDDLLWTLLVFSGYLKVTEQTDEEMFALKIPNYEVQTVYRKMIRNWFAEKVRSDQLEEMLRALENGDAYLFERMLRIVVKAVMSCHDLGSEPERVYHALVLGMLVWMSGKYQIRSNRESGYGRYDLMLKPLNPEGQGIIIEFRRLEGDDKKTPEKALEKALKQIEEKGYTAELEAAGIRKILKLAVVFKGKELWVKHN